MATLFDPPEARSNLFGTPLDCTPSEGQGKRRGQTSAEGRREAAQSHAQAKPSMLHGIFRRSDALLIGREGETNRSALRDRNRQAPQLRTGRLQLERGNRLVQTGAAAGDDELDRAFLCLGQRAASFSFGRRCHAKHDG